MGNREKVQSVIIISTIVVNGIWSRIVSLLSIWAGGVWRIFYLGVTMFPLLCKNVKIPHWEYNSFVWDWDGLSSLQSRYPDDKIVNTDCHATLLHSIVSTKLKNVGIHLLWQLSVFRVGYIWGGEQVKMPIVANLGFQLLVDLANQLEHQKYLDQSNFGDRVTDWQDNHQFLRRCMRGHSTLVEKIYLQSRIF